MEKRSFVLMESPQKKFHHESCKKVKISISPKKNNMQMENNVNLTNLKSSDPGFDINDLFFDDDDDEFLESVMKKHEEKPNLDLTKFKRCKVKFIETHVKSFEKVLSLEEKRTSNTTKCCLKGIWYDTEVSQGDVVSLKGLWCKVRKMFLITNESGMIVVVPDQLISGTSVVGSLFCARKSVLNERFRGVDAGDSIIMHIGSIVHEIIQKALKDNLTSLKEINKVKENMLSSSDVIQLLYSCNISLKDLEKELNPFITKIHHFMQQYVVGNAEYMLPSNSNDNNQQYTGRIAEITDIEENIWSPRLGLKGKIDVSATVYPPNNFYNQFRKMIPIEIKTGKSSFSLEHKGQLILYQMMLKDLGKQIDSGLLLYIRDGIMSEIHSTHAEENGLITMRNRLAKYLSMDVVTRDRKINLPEPINHRSACEKCPYNTLCCAFLKKEPNHQLRSNHPIMKVQEKKIEHLTDEHYEYFLHWCHLISLEQNESQRNFKCKHLWTKSPEDRAKKGTTLPNLKLSDIVQPDHDEFIHKFECSYDLNDSKIESGDYLIVSTDKQCFVTAGRIVNMQASTVTLSLPKDLSHKSDKELYHLDKYESQSQSIFNFTNVGILLEDDEEKGINRLRNIIIEKFPATFSNTLPKSVRQTVDKTLLKLNSVQRTAVLKALTCENYMLIKGLPGSGKTQTLVNLIHLLNIMNKSILITSHTNSAVDNILLRLKERGINFLRLGSSNSRIHQSLHDESEASLIQKCKSVDDLESLYTKFKIVAVTCLGSAHGLLTRRRFDFCLVDEATQIFQPTVIRPLLAAARFILVGDPEQLAPLVRSNDARLLGANESLFERLDTKDTTFVLGLQYRMNRTITKLANNLTYNGELKCADELVEKATMEIPDLVLLKEKFAFDKWLAKVLSPHIDQATSLINTGDVYEMARQFSASLKIEPVDSSEKSKLYVNYCEIAIVVYIVDILIECGVSKESIGIIAPYKNQVDTLKKIFQVYHSVEVNTVDQYQGRDKKIIIYSCTLSETATDTAKTSSETEILEDRRRLTVAITRAKHKLIMIGDVNCLNKYSPFRDLFKHMNSMSKVQVQNEMMGFSWNRLMDNLKLKLK